MMIYRRTWFGWVLWFLYTVLCVGVMAVCMQALLRCGAVFAVVLSVLPAAALYWCIRIVSEQVRMKWPCKERTAGIAAGVVFALALAAAVFVRILCLNNYVSGSALPYGIQAYGAKDPALQDQPCWEAALELLGKDRAAVGTFEDGTEYFYVELLSVALSFLGAKPEAAVFLQIVLQIVGIVLVYAVTGKLAGRLPACAAALYLAGSGSCLRMLFEFTPEWMFFDLYMIVMLLAAAFVKAYCADHIARPAAVLFSVCMGALIGALACLDVIAFSLLVIVLTAALGRKDRREGKAPYHGAAMNAAVIVVSTGICAAVWLALKPFVSGMGSGSPVGSWLAGFEACYRNSYPDAGLRAGLELYPICALAMSASFLVFEFFRSGKEQNYTPWILLCMAAAPVPAAAYGEHGFTVLSLYVWIVLAGLGLQNCLFGDKAKVVQAVIEEINHTVETKNGYIENPLPLPKKHVKREMEYGYEVEEKDMKYDVDVPDGDDFEI